MATSKQPRFPNPPLEWGVPQYPTPNVPDFYTKDGHIILVEKVSTEKGPYNPQPLDGSITYSKRDANKWPSTLYLVYQKPDETGQFVYNYYANDRTLASQDAWNFGLDYSANNPAYPITSRTYIVPRSQYETVALGTHDPIFGGNQIIAQQKKVELGDDNPLHSRYVAVQRVYETIPGPVLTGKKLDERGDLETITTQTVVAGTAPASDGLLVTQTSVQPVDSVKSTKTTGTVESYTTLFTKANKAGLLGDTSTTDDIVPPSTNPDALSTTVLESSVDALTATKSRKRTTTSSGPTELDSNEKKGGLLGETTIAQSIVAYGSSPDSLSTSVISSSVEAIDSSKSKKTTITSTGPTSLASPSKKGGLLGEVSVVESIVAAGTSPDSLSATVLSSEVTAIDSAKSKKTTTTATGPTLLGGISLQEFGIANTKEQIVSYGESPTITENTIKSDIQPIDSAKSKLVQVDYASLTTLTNYQYDEFFEQNLTITRDIIPTSTGALSHSNGILSYKDEAIDPYKKQRIIVSTPALPPTRTEYKTGTYTSPLLVFDIQAESKAMFCGSEHRVKLTPITRASQSRQTVFKTIKSYSYGPPTVNDSGLLAPELKEIAFTGYVINFNLGGALCDHLVAPDNSGGGLGLLVNSCYGNDGFLQQTFEKWDISATSISATTYLGYIGTYKKISWESSYFKSGIWEAKEIWVKVV